MFWIVADEKLQKLCPFKIDGQTENKANQQKNPEQNNWKPINNTKTYAYSTHLTQVFCNGLSQDFYKPCPLHDHCSSNSEFRIFFLSSYMSYLEYGASKEKSFVKSRHFHFDCSWQVSELYVGFATLMDLNTRVGGWGMRG